MGILGKDMFDMDRMYTNTRVEFGAAGYWVERRCTRCHTDLC